MFSTHIFFSFALTVSAAFAAVLPREAEAQMEPEALIARAASISGTHSGAATWFDVGLGACGEYDVNNDLIVAVSHTLFDNYPGYNHANPNKNPVCNKKIKATWKGKSVTVKVVDRCTGCAEYDLDFSPKAFSELASKSEGRLKGMTWKFE